LRHLRRGLIIRPRQCLLVTDIVVFTRLVSSISKPRKIGPFNMPGSVLVTNKIIISPGSSKLRYASSYAGEIALSAGGGFAKTSPNVITGSEIPRPAGKQSRNSPLITERLQTERNAHDWGTISLA